MESEFLVSPILESTHVQACTKLLTCPSYVHMYIYIHALNMCVDIQICENVYLCISLASKYIQCSTHFELDSLM